MQKCHRLVGETQPASRLGSLSDSEAAVPCWWDVSLGVSSAVRWLRIHLPMPGTQARSLVQEDSTCCRAAEPMSHSY